MLVVSVDGFRKMGTKRRRLLGACVIALIALPHLTTEYFWNRDDLRFLAKGIAMVVGLPLIILWAFAVFGWASRKAVGVLRPLLVGAVTSGIFFAGLLWATRAAILWVAPQLPVNDWRGVVALNVGFAIGLTSFALWVLAFVLPFAVEDARVRVLEADKLRTEVEVAQLRSRLEPHFLLNTLNAIAGLVTEDPRKACQLLGTLGDLLRDSAMPDDEMQTLDEQIEWLQRYAQILEARHPGHLGFRWEVGAATRRALLPRLLLQPLVENAVKHGALMRAGGGAITVRTELSDGAKVICTIADDGPGVPNGATRPGAFGLVSVRRRLALRYSDAATLRLESSPAGTRSIVEWPLEKGSPS
jgi:signal transduction histidine kinase